MNTSLKLTKKYSLIVFGASTGGPGVLLSILQALPDTFTTPILIVQHIEGSFVEGFVSWLKSELSRPILLAKEGDVIQNNTIYVADTVGNLSLTTAFSFHYSKAPKEQLYTPNIDYFFSSLVNLEVNGSAALLTGMGADGAKGLKLLAENGWATYIQSPETCIVNGMPGAARKLSPRHHVASPKQISQFIRTHELAKPRSNYGA